MFKPINLKKSTLVSLIMGLSINVTAANIPNNIQQNASSTIQLSSFEKGKKLWQQKHVGKKPYAVRSCTSCHGSDVTLMGKHIKTNKQIQPMAVSSNPKRFTKKAKVDKWFLRNCKWTMGRACTQQEKNDISHYLKNQ